MPALASDLRKALETTVVKARDWPSVVHGMHSRLWRSVPASPFPR
jgi:hypothetical protein